MLKEEREKELLAKKTGFIIKNYTGGALEVANKFGYKKSTSIVNICKFDPKKPKESRSIVRLQMEGLQTHYQIPITIFENSIPYDEKLISKMIDEYRETFHQTTSIFQQSQRLIEKLEGEWYSYFYPSADFVEVQCIQTTIYNNYSIIDEHNNKGVLNIGTDQSIIIKESNNSKNLTSIVFNNIAVTYKVFPYSMISRTNSRNRHIVYFGFFSREKLDTEVAKEVLGEDRSTMQLQMPYEFEDRLASYYRLI